MNFKSEYYKIESVISKSQVISLLRWGRAKISLSAVVFILIATYTGYFSYYTVMNQQTFQTYAYDLGIYMQSFWSTLHGGGLFYTTLWEGSRFAAHFEPILFLILPFYAAIPRAETLLILQSFVIALGALPLYWIARDELGQKGGVVFAALYLLYPALHGVNRFDFHGVAFALPLLLFTFYMFKVKHYRWGMLGAVLSIMCREDVALVLVFMGLYWLWTERWKVKIGFKNLIFLKEREVLFPLGLILIGAVYVYLAFVVIIPHFNPTEGYGFLWLYKDPLHSLVADAHTKLQYLLFLFGPLLFIPLLRPSVLLIALPLFAQNLVTDWAPMYGITSHRVALLIPWLFIAGAYGVKWLTDGKFKNIRKANAVLLYMLLPAAVIFTTVISPSPLSLNKAMPQVTLQEQHLEQMIASIPEEASIYAQNSLFPHIANRLHAYETPRDKDFFAGYLTPGERPEWGTIIPWSNSGNFDYILVDQKTLQGADSECLYRLAKEYKVIFQEEGTYLYQKRDVALVNILQNGAFEIGTKPVEWELAGAGASYTRSNEQVKAGSYSLKLTRSGSPAIARQPISSYSYYVGHQLTFSAWVWSSDAFRARLRIVDNSGTVIMGDYHPGDNTWQWLSVSWTISANMTMPLAECRVDNGDVSSYFDDAAIWVN
jgi:uncharacterized membrane protein